MTKEVVIKSNKYGINLILDESLPFPELLALVGQKFRETGNFFKDAKMAISFEGRELTAGEESAIIDTITENSTLKIVSVISHNAEMEEMMRQRVEASSRQTAAPVSPSVPQDDPAFLQPTADFYKGSLRSGQTLECASSVTLIGDVNPGAKIISDGSIVILGSMKGNAHAGASGDSRCFIFAMDMRPIQLQIGDYIAKSPDRAPAGRFSRRKPKADQASYSSQIAVVRDGYICIEPMTKKSRDRL